MSSHPRLEIHIEELVLEGFAPGDRHRIGEAIQHELTRLFAQTPVSGKITAHDGAARVDAGAFTAKPGSSPAEIGAAVARAVHGRLT